MLVWFPALGLGCSAKLVSFCISPPPPPVSGIRPVVRECANHLFGRASKHGEGIIVLPWAESLKQFAREKGSLVRTSEGTDICRGIAIDLHCTVWFGPFDSPSTVGQVPRAIPTNTIRGVGLQRVRRTERLISTRASCQGLICSRPKSLASWDLTLPMKM